MSKKILVTGGGGLTIHHIPGPLGVRGRNSDNRLIREKLGWEPSQPLSEGIAKTYSWIAKQVAQRDKRLAAPELSAAAR